MNTRLLLHKYIKKQRKDFKPTIFMFAFMPRSGTNYLNYLLCLNKNIVVSENEEYLMVIYLKHLVNYQQNVNSFMLSRFGHIDLDSIEFSSLGLNSKLNYIQDKNNKHLLFKHTNLINAEYFFDIFPYEK